MVYVCCLNFWCVMQLSILCSVDEVPGNHEEAKMPQSATRQIVIGLSLIEKGLDKVTLYKAGNSTRLWHMRKRVTFVKEAAGTSLLVNDVVYRQTPTLSRKDGVKLPI